MNLAVPQTYSDIWGDWYGVFAWSREDAGEAAAVRRRRGSRCRWCSASCRRRSRSSAGSCCSRARSAGALEQQLLVALLPLAGIAGYLYFTVSYPMPDGDVLKPTYMLSTLGAWALCFGWLADRAGQPFAAARRGGARGARAAHPAVRRLQGRGGLVLRARQAIALGVCRLARVPCSRACSSGTGCATRRSTPTCTCMRRTAATWRPGRFRTATSSTSTRRSPSRCSCSARVAGAAHYALAFKALMALFGVGDDRLRSRDVARAAGHACARRGCGRGDRRRAAACRADLPQRVRPLAGVSARRSR